MATGVLNWLRRGNASTRKHVEAIAEYSVGYEPPPRPPIPMPGPRSPEAYGRNQRQKSIKELTMDEFEAAAAAVEKKAKEADMIHQDMMQHARELAENIRTKGRQAAGYMEAQIVRTAKMATMFTRMDALLETPASVNSTVGATVRELEDLAHAINDAHEFVAGSVNGLCRNCGLDALHTIHLLEPKEKPEPAQETFPRVVQHREPET